MNNGNETTASAGGRGGPAGERASAVIDLACIAANAAELRRAAGSAELMAIVKADGYGHGAVPAARAALRGGATMVGVATLAEAVGLRAGGIDAPLLAWLWPPGEDVGAAIAADVQITVSSLAHLAAVRAAATLSPTGAVDVHIKVDTGLGRNGAGPADFVPLVQAAAAAERTGQIRVVGIMSHLACADIPGDPSVATQTAAFICACRDAAAAGLRPRWRHLANTAATLAHPKTHFDLVRCGIGLYGLAPIGDPARLRPAMTLRATVALTKRVGPGWGVSYGLTYRTTAVTTLALVPLGYGDGIPRAAGSAGEVLLAGRRRRIAGRVAMDQFVIDCGDDAVAAGDEVIMFGPGDNGEPTAEDLAASCGTIGYEIVTRIGPRVDRRYVGGM